MTIQPRLQPGTLAYVLHEPPDANTVRAQPRTTAQETGKLYPGTVMTVLEGPEIWDGHLFWRVASRALAEPGWTSEGDTRYFLDRVAHHSACPPTKPARLITGDLAMVTFDPSDANTFLTEPRPDAPAVAAKPSLVPGTAMTVLGSFQCYVGPKGAILYRQVKVGDLIGWTGECDDKNYWLEPLVINFKSAPVGKQYMVQAGDTWQKIATQVGRTVDQLMKDNLGLHRAGLRLEAGDLVRITP